MKRKVRPDPKWPSHPELPKSMTVGEVSAYLHVHRNTIYRLIKQHKIPAFYIGSSLRLSVSSIDRWVLEQQRAGRQ